MANTICLQIPMGAKMVETTREMKVWQAEARLLSKAGRRYTAASRKGEEAKLYAKYFVCPYCGKYEPANILSKTVAYSALGSYFPQSAGKEDILQWASLQMSLFESEAGSALAVHAPLEMPNAYACPHCGGESRASEGKRRVTLTRRGKKISMKCEIVGMNELLDLKWNQNKALFVRFPIYETLTFDMDRGSVYVRVEDGQGNVMSCRDVTENPESLLGGAAQKALRHKPVKRKLARLFRQVWGSELPYGSNQLGLQSFFRMTRFVGYDKNFYAAIPYMHRTDTVDKSFAAQVRRLHFAKHVPQIFARSSLPQVKSVRRCMFEEAGLFFYLQEIQRVWEILQDPNLLCSFLSSKGAYTVLSAIHDRPGIIDFLADYCAVKGRKALLEQMGFHWAKTMEKAVDYCAMSLPMRCRTRELWKEKGLQKMPVAQECCNSMPMRRPDPKIPDCTVRGYLFMWLRSGNDYAKAAKQLKNCLEEWTPYMSTVMAVMKGGKVVAAIEVRQNLVMQARGYDNRTLENDRQLYRAVEAWMEKFGLEWKEDSEEDDEDDFIVHVPIMPEVDLPF